MSRRKRPTLNDEIRRLQQAQALLIAIQHAANYDVDFSVSDTLLVVLALIGESLDGLDRMEVSLFRADAFKATRGSNMTLGPKEDADAKEIRSLGNRGRLRALRVRKTG